MSHDEDQLRALFDRLSDRHATHGTDGAWLKERLRRRRARQSAAAAAVTVLSVGALALGGALPRGDDRLTTIATESLSPTPRTSATPTPTVQQSPAKAPVPPALTGLTGSQVVVVQGTRLELLDADTGQRSTLPTDRRLRDYDRLDVLAVNEELVLLGNNNTGAGTGPFDAFVTTAGPGSSLRVIGQASYLRPSQEAGRVWLVSENDTNVGTPGTTLTEVDLNGAVHRSATFANTFGVEPFADGFLRATQGTDGSTGDDTELVDAKGRRLHLYPGRRVDVRGNTAVISQAAEEPCRQDCRLLVLTFDSTVRERTVTVGALPYLTGATLSPDGARLFVTDAVTDDGPAERLIELDLADGQRREVVAAWSARYYGASMTFSHDGRWMFFIDATGKNVDAYELSTRGAFRVRGTFATITQLAVAR